MIQLARIVVAVYSAPAVIILGYLMEAISERI